MKTCGDCGTNYNQETVNECPICHPSKLNSLMARLALYAETDPYNKEFNKKLTDKLCRFKPKKEITKTTMAKKTKNHRVEIARSFTFKLNLGNYQSADFFCSEKKETTEKKSQEVSDALESFCRTEVLKAVNAFRKTVADQKEKAKPKASQEPKHKFTATDPGKPEIAVEGGVEKVVSYKK